METIIISLLVSSFWLACNLTFWFSEVRGWGTDQVHQENIEKVYRKNENDRSQL